MKKSKKICLIFIFAMILALSSGCTNATKTDEAQDKTVADNQSAITADPEKKSAQEAEVLKEPELNHTYTTRLGEINAITYPAFSFGWYAIKEDVTSTWEWVTLSNERGVTVDFINIHQKDIGGGSAVLYTEIEVSKVVDSAIIPGYVQATDYSNLGKFMVAELKATDTMDTINDTNFVPVEDGAVSYAVLPESTSGEQIVNSAYYMDLAFWYSGNTMFVAFAPDGQFTPQEEKEVIAILSSFKTE